MTTTPIRTLAYCVERSEMARRSSSRWLVGMLSVGAVGILAMVLRSKVAQAAAKPPPSPMPLIDDDQWQRAKLTEYYPDLPDTATAKEKRLEGGANARHQLIPVITLDQHRSDPLGDLFEHGLIA